jgi:hypothetical protein
MSTTKHIPAVERNVNEPGWTRVVAYCNTEHQIRLQRSGKKESIGQQVSFPIFESHASIIQITSFIANKLDGMNVFLILWSSGL